MKEETIIETLLVPLNKRYRETSDETVAIKIFELVENHLKDAEMHEMERYRNRHFGLNTMIGSSFGGMITLTVILINQKMNFMDWAGVIMALMISVLWIPKSLTELQSDRDNDDSVFAIYREVKKNVAEKIENQRLEVEDLSLIEKFSVKNIPC